MESGLVVISHPRESIPRSAAPHQPHYCDQKVELRDLSGHTLYYNRRGLLPYHDRNSSLKLAKAQQLALR